MRSRPRSVFLFGGIAVWLALFVLSMLFDKIEGMLTAGVAAVFLVLPRLGEKWFERVESALARLARRPAVSILAVVLFVAAVRLALLPVMPIPVPFVHDEFSYVFAADTFLSGRLTNPPHPMWVHFETFHVSEQPTRFSKYFAAQGLILAFGQAVFGHPWFGVVLSMGLMCGAIVWMLRQWVAPPWALLGGSLVALRMGIASYWMNSYWGGAAAAIGGALVWGALPGALRGNKTRYAVILGIGLFVLANSRPLEGAFVSLPAGVMMVVRLFRVEPERRKRWLVRSAAPLALLVAIGAAAVMYYNQRLTGDPLLMPHRAHDGQYATTSYSLLHILFGEAAPRERQYNHKVLRDFWQVESNRIADVLRSPGGFFFRRFQNFRNAWVLYVAPLFMLPLVAAPRLFRGWRMLLPAGAAVFFLFMINFEMNPQPHYFAPALGLFCLLGVRCTAYLRRWVYEGQPTGLGLTRAVAIVCVVGLGVCTATQGSADEQGLHDRCFVRYMEHPLVQREEIVKDLHARGGRHLIIVRYADDHDVYQEWVYNRADIDGAPVVWAREMTPEKDRELIDYFSDRQVWLLEPDQETPQLVPYGR